MRDLYAAVWDKSGGPAWVARHRMTAADYQTAFNQFLHDGYRLISVSGYGVDGQALYAALWDKSAGPAWEAHHGMTAAQYQTTFNTLLGNGFRLRQVCGYAVGNTDFYAAIWDKTGGPAWQAHHRMTADQYQQTFDDLQHKGFRLTWVSTYAVQGADLYAAIWEQTGGGAWEAHHRMSEATFQANSVALAARGLALRCVDACSPNGTDLYAALWQAPASPGAIAHHGMTAATYQQFFDQSVSQGLRPAVISGYTGNNPVDAVLVFTMQKQLEPNWCWAATSVSIAHYYNPASPWTQCSMANAQLGRSDCCGAGAGGACNVYGYLDQALSTSDHLGNATGSTTAFADVTTEVANGRPLGIRVAWSGGGAHFIAATGVEEGNLVFVSDCGSGTRSVVAYNTLVTAYHGSGSWTNSYFTKP